MSGFPCCCRPDGAFDWYQTPWSDVSDLQTNVMYLYPTRYPAGVNNPINGLLPTYTSANMGFAPSLWSDPAKDAAWWRHIIASSSNASWVFAYRDGNTDHPDSTFKVVSVGTSGWQSSAHASRTSGKLKATATPVSDAYIHSTLSLVEDTDYKLYLPLYYVNHQWVYVEIETDAGGVLASAYVDVLHKTGATGEIEPDDDNGAVYEFPFASPSSIGTFARVRLYIVDASGSTYFSDTLDEAVGLGSAVLRKYDPGGGGSDITLMNVGGAPHALKIYYLDPTRTKYLSDGLSTYQHLAETDQDFAGYEVVPSSVAVSNYVIGVHVASELSPSGLPLVYDTLFGDTFTGGGTSCGTLQTGNASFSGPGIHPLATTLNVYTQTGRTIYVGYPINGNQSAPREGVVASYSLVGSCLSPTAFAGFASATSGYTRKPVFYHAPRNDFPRFFGLRPAHPQYHRELFTDEEPPEFATREFTFSAAITFGAYEIGSEEVQLNDDLEYVFPESEEDDPCEPAGPQSVTTTTIRPGSGVFWSDSHTNTYEYGDRRVMGLAFPPPWSNMSTHMATANSCVHVGATWLDSWKGVAAGIMFSVKRTDTFDVIDDIPYRETAWAYRLVVKISDEIVLDKPVYYGDQVLVGGSRLEARGLRALPGPGGGGAFAFFKRRWEHSPTPEDGSYPDGEESEYPWSLQIHRLNGGLLSSIVGGKNDATDSRSDKPMVVGGTRYFVFVRDFWLYDERVDGDWHDCWAISYDGNVRYPVSVRVNDADDVPLDIFTTADYVLPTHDPVNYVGNIPYTVHKDTW